MAASFVLKVLHVFIWREVVVDDPSSRTTAFLAVDDQWGGHHLASRQRFRAFALAALVLAGDLAWPPSRPNAIALRFFFRSCFLAMTDLRRQEFGGMQIISPKRLA